MTAWIDVCGHISLVSPDGVVPYFKKKCLVTDLQLENHISFPSVTLVHESFNPRPLLPFPGENSVRVHNYGFSRSSGKFERLHYSFSKQMGAL